MSKEAKRLEKEIEKEKRKLIKHAKTYGLDEDFGQKEYKRLENKYFNLYYKDEDIRRLLDCFFDWCINYDGK